MRSSRRATGFKSWISRVPGPPVAAVRVWLRGGSRLETIPGQALVAGRLLAEGTSRRDWRRIGEEAEDLGCSIAASAGYSVQALSLDGLSLDLERMLSWATELVEEATFPADRCEWVCEQTAAELESLSDLPEVVAEWSFMGQLYPGHPLGRPLQGTADDIDKLTPDDCASFHRQARARGVLLAVAGDIDPAAVAEFLDISSLTAELTGTRADEPDEPPQPVERLRRVELPRGEQAHLIVGARTVRRADPDFDALRLLGVILGAGGLVGRVPWRVREREGLAYSCDVGTVFGAGLDEGRMAVTLGTSPGTVERALEAVREEILRVHDEGVSEDEVESARGYLLGREPFRRETARQRALLGLESLLWELAVDDESWCRERLEDVSTNDIERVARRYLDPARLVATIATPS